MTLTVSIGPVIALIAGILILIVPRLLNFIVAIYLILIGLHRPVRRQSRHPRLTRRGLRESLAAARTSSLQRERREVCVRS